ncbi:MAG TPA: double-strand break repair protein AddB [Pseudolabrys sp.]|nr:double-strand break repair protein AddB [Pseudolabrys sp.]
MPASRSNLFTIPASAPFLRTLIDALLAGRLVEGFPKSRDPLELARATLYLPTRRACRLAREVFLQHIEGDASILPRIVAIGDIDDDEIAFAEAATGALAAQSLALPPALSGLDRDLPLAALILRWAQTIAASQMKGQVKGQASDHVPVVASNPATALALARDLARLMDDMTTRQVSWERLDELVPDDLDKYWDVTLGFLKFIRAQWPAILNELVRMEPAERRDRLIAAEAARLANSTDPVIAAGSTGSMPATAALLETIARLPHGAVVLPGLDTDLDESTWATISGDTEHGHNHPQFAMAGLLARLGVARSQVATLVPPAAHGREPIVSEALRPAASSDLWKDRLREPTFAKHADAAMASIAVIEAANAEDESLAIAVALRETLEEPGKTAALVTPDVALGRRVMAALARWNVPVEDSRGVSLADTPHGLFARLAAEAAIEGAAPVPLLALLKHPLAPFAADAVAALERAILRGARPRHGTSGLQAALTAFRADLVNFRAGKPSSLHRSDPRLSLTDAGLDAAADAIAQLKNALAPLEQLPRAALPIAAVAARHAEVVAALGGMTRELDEAFGEIGRAGALSVGPADYAELFHASIAGKTIYRPTAGARVRIFGLLEARLQSVDRLVLGGLVEGVWPPETRGDPWLSRPMRHELGLDLPERRVGLSAHDFAQGLGAPEVILSRAAKLAGAPTVASRFVQRLAAVAGSDRWDPAIKRGARFVALARQIDEAGAPKPAARPAPAPPLAARPRQLSVTEIEDLLRDPYTIYARHVLKLPPLDDIDAPPGAAERGTVIHDAIGEFGKQYPAKLPDNPAAVLIEIGRATFAPLSEIPEARAFWWPRFLRIAEWMAGFETTRRANLKSFAAEIGGRIEIPFAGGTFTLTVRADRIECLADGRYAIIDYKTGAPPTGPQVRAGLSPQLTLEAAILRGGGFKNIPAGASVAELLYVRLRGGAEAGEEKPIDFDDSTPDAQADHALTELTTVLQQFADPAKPYYSLLHPMWSTHYGTYDHLARVQEWSLTGGAKDDGGGE